MPSNPLISCQEVQPHLFEFSEGMLPEHVRQSILTHLSTCPTCAATHQRLININKTIEREKAIEPDPFLSTRLMQRLEAGLERQQHGLYFRIKPILQPALITLGLLVAIFSGLLIGQRESKADQPIVTENSRVEELRTELLIGHFVDENQTLFLNN